ncbi:lymphocyte antigen 6 complex locus protein G5c [Rhynchonycteris naso]
MATIGMPASSPQESRRASRHHGNALPRLLAGHEGGIDHLRPRPSRRKSGRFRAWPDRKQAAEHFRQPTRGPCADKSRASRGAGSGQAAGGAAGRSAEPNGSAHTEGWQAVIRFMAGPTYSGSPGPLGLHSTPQPLSMVLLIMLVMMSLVFGVGSVLLRVPGISDTARREPPHAVQFPKYLRCYRCVLETKELGCLLGSDVCLAAPGSSCVTRLIKNSTGSDVMVSDCCHKEQMSDCSDTRPSPVFGFWIFSRCCFRDFCNSPQNRVSYMP